MTFDAYVINFFIIALLREKNKAKLFATKLNIIYESIKKKISEEDPSVQTEMNRIFARWASNVATEVESLSDDHNSLSNLYSNFERVENI